MVDGDHYSQSLEVIPGVHWRWLVVLTDGVDLVIDG